jgi:hypothetical protein
VVAVLEGDDATPSGGVAGGAEGDVVGVGAGVAEVDPPVPSGGRDEVEQLLGEADGVRVGAGEQGGAGGAAMAAVTASTMRGCP